MSRISQPFAGFIVVVALSVGLPSTTPAASMNQACAASGRTTKSATSGQGLMLCQSGTYQSFTSGSNAAAMPTSFTFTAQTGVAFNTVACSNTVTISGLSVPVYAAVSPGATGSPYVKVNGSTPGTTTYGAVFNGNTLQVCVTSANYNMLQIDTAVSVGSSNFGFSVKTGNKQPNPFTFNNPANPVIKPTTVDNCATANISALSLPSPVVVTTNHGSVTALNINGTGWAAYTGSQTISNNQSLCVRITTSAVAAEVHTVTVTIGNAVPGVIPQSAPYTITNP